MLYLVDLALTGAKTVLFLALPFSVKICLIDEESVGVNELIDILRISISISSLVGVKENHRLGGFRGFQQKLRAQDSLPSNTIIERIERDD